MTTEPLTRDIAFRRDAARGAQARETLLQGRLYISSVYLVSRV